MLSGVKRSPRGLTTLGLFGDCIGCQRDIRCHHQIARFCATRDLVVCHIETCRHGQHADVARPRHFDRLVGDQCQLDPAKRSAAR